MSSVNPNNPRMFYVCVFHSIVVLTIGLAAGLMLTFSLLEAVNLWPFPIWDVEIPGSTRGWQAAHVGGILNGVMCIALLLLSLKLQLTDRQQTLSCWFLIVIGWGNTVFYWAANFAPNRGLSAVDTQYGSADVCGVLAFLGGGTAMFVAFALMAIYGKAALRLMKQ